MNRWRKETVTMWHDRGVSKCYCGNHTAIYELFKSCYTYETYIIQFYPSKILYSLSHTHTQNIKPWLTKKGWGTVPS